MHFSRRFIFVVVPVVLFVLLYLLLPKPPLFEGLSSSQVISARNHEVLRLTLSADDKFRVVLSHTQVAPTLVEAVLLKEDNLFYWHAGVNVWSLVRGAFQTYVLKSQRQGGSTITMQLVRLRYGLSTNTVGGKICQIIKAIELERHYTKDEILSVYLSLVPYGRNVEGVGAASFIYFKKDPMDLNLSEALTLAVIPQSPGERDPNREKNLQALQLARQALYAEWIKEHPGDVNKKTIMDLPIQALSVNDLPFLAPHFVDSVIKEDARTPIIVTTLDLKQQRLLERHVTHFVDANRSIGVENASALLVNVNTQEILAAVGSKDFFDAKIQGQVNGTLARRSPGSALKPFVYALALDQGLVHSQSLLKDTPSHFGGGYDPENFERDFLGPITVHDALIKSRNIPALTLTADVKKPSVYEFFKSAGIQQMREENFYGLALALGGVEVTMEEMASLYVMLANGGWIQPLRVFINGPHGNEIRNSKHETRNKLGENTKFEKQNVSDFGFRISDLGARQLLSSEASFLTLDILKDNPRPETFRYREGSRKFPIAWKTGTSYSFRDAWTVGVFGPYVLCVWVGNFDGRGNPSFVGREVAAPLFFSIAEDVRIQNPWTTDFTSQANTLNIKKVKVCSVSGDMPGEDCPHTKDTWFIPGKSPIKTCTIHRKIAIDPKTGSRLCLDSVGNEDLRSAIYKVYEFWPTDLMNMFRLAGLPREVPPAFASQCSLDVRSSQGKSPEIISPLGAVTYYLQARKTAETIAFKAVADSDAHWLNWFVNNEFVGRVEINQTFYWSPQAGEFTVRVVDDEGRAAVQKLVVKMVP